MMVTEFIWDGVKYYRAHWWIDGKYSTVTRLTYADAMLAARKDKAP